MDKPVHWGDVSNPLEHRDPETGHRARSENSSRIPGAYRQDKAGPELLGRRCRPHRNAKYKASWRCWLSRNDRLRSSRATRPVNCGLGAQPQFTRMSMPPRFLRSLSTTSCTPCTVQMSARTNNAGCWPSGRGERAMVALPQRESWKPGRRSASRAPMGCRRLVPELSPSISALRAKNSFLHSMQALIRSISPWLGISISGESIAVPTSPRGQVC